MLRRLRPRSIYDVCAALALFIALGGTAYAVNTIGSDDVIDDSLLSQDIRNQTVGTADLALGSVWGSRIRDDGITSSHVINNSLKGQDIDEQTFTAPLVRAFVRVVPSTCAGPIGNESCAIERSKGVTSVRRTGTGVYCITAPALDREKVSPAVSVDYLATLEPGGDASAMIHPGFGGCPTSKDFIVLTQRQPTTTVNAGGGVNNASAVGPSQFSDQVGFTLVMP